MSIDNNCYMRLAADVLGVENHHELIRYDQDFAYRVTKDVKLQRAYQATLCIANRLELLVRDCQPPATFDVLDLVDGALRPPFPMLRPDELSLIRFIRKCLGSSPMAKIEITVEREIALLAFVYDEEAKRSILKPVDSSDWRSMQRAS